jgi:RNA polymerase sigma factor (sigma-70 family)
MLRHDGAGQTDGTLLESYITRQDEAAFEALVCRHGPMVLGVCRRVLQNEADAEDAFQATFLVLVRRAGSIRPRGMVGNWLYGVAQNTARKAKAMNSRMRAREREMAARPKPAATSQDWQQQQALLDQELQALPDKYRAPIVLCDLEGKSIKEAARHLDCPPGTIGTRLARGRRMLARRLVRRGLILSAGAIATVLPQNAASASVSLPLLTSTIKAACLLASGQAASGIVGAKTAALTEGVLKAMLLTKLKIATAALLGLAVLGAGLAGLNYHAPAAEPALVKQPEHDGDASAQNPAQKPDPKDEGPPWMREFREIYSLADGEVLKRISKFPECRAEYIKNSPRLPPGTEKVPITMALRQRETGGELFMWGFGGGDGTIGSTMLLIGIPMGKVEADNKLLGTPTGGDFVFRQDAPVEKLVPALERILREECKLPVKLTFKEVEREVVVARGMLKIVPLEGQKKNHVEVFGKEIGKGEAWGSRKDLHGFLLDLGGFLGRRFVNEAKSGKDEVFTYGLSVRQNPRQRLASDLDKPSPVDPVPLPKFDPAIEAQDRDPKLVLPNVAKQTGLTFTAEKRKVRVLFLEKSDK